MKVSVRDVAIWVLLAVIFAGAASTADADADAAAIISSPSSNGDIYFGEGTTTVDWRLGTSEFKTQELRCESGRTFYRDPGGGMIRRLDLSGQDQAFTYPLEVRNSGVIRSELDSSQLGVNGPFFGGFNCKDYARIYDPSTDSYSFTEPLEQVSYEPVVRSSDVYPVVSPDGRNVVFISNRPGIEDFFEPDVGTWGTGFFSMSSEGGEPIQLTDFASEFYPRKYGLEVYPQVFTPDGRWVLAQFSHGNSDDCPNYSMGIIKISTTDPGKIEFVTRSVCRDVGLRAMVGEGNPTVAPSGENVVFIRSFEDPGCDQNWNFNLWKKSLLEDGPAEQLTFFGCRGSSASTFPQTPAYSPDGSRIAFLESVAEGVSRVGLMAADGSDVQRIGTVSFEGSAGADSVSWSPDGRQLVLEFQTYEQGLPKVNLMTIDAANPEAQPFSAELKASVSRPRRLALKPLAEVGSNPMWAPKIGPPRVTLAARPAKRAKSKVVRFRMFADSPKAKLQCLVDGRQKQCRGGRLVLRNLRYGKHSIKLRATRRGESSRWISYRWRSIPRR